MHFGSIATPFFKTDKQALEMGMMLTDSKDSLDFRGWNIPYTSRSTAFKHYTILA